MHPRDFAELTDHQILHNYLYPAAERAEQAKSDGRPVNYTEDEPAPRTEPPPRAAIVGMLVGLGATKEVANAEYDRQLADWIKKQKGP